MSGSDGAGMLPSCAIAAGCGAVIIGAASTSAAVLTGHFSRPQPRAAGVVQTRSRDAIPAWYSVTDAWLLARLRLYGRIAGPFPETEEDRIREREEATRVVAFSARDHGRGMSAA